jgi:prepilin-type N-terminal cleavage/methylation domain-containing protein
MGRGGSPRPVVLWRLAVFLFTMKTQSCVSRKRGGFTLIELVIVMSVLAILMGVVIKVINPTTFQGKSRDARRQTDLTAIQSALELYYATNRAYPAGGGRCSTSESGWYGSCASYPASLSCYLSPYISAIPRDPLNNSTYKYCYKNHGDDGNQGYELDANMEYDTVIEANDGGNCNTLYEVGTDLTLYDCY